MPFAPGEVGFPGGGVEPQDGGDAKSTALRELYEEEGITLNPSRVFMTDSWVTPREIPSKRYYFVQYFYASVGEVPQPSANESVQSYWDTPTNLLTGFENQKLPMVIPTWWYLNELKEVKTVGAAIKTLRSRKGQFIPDRRVNDPKVKRYLELADITGKYV